MKKTLKFTAASACMFATLSVQADLVTNPGFETTPAGTPYTVPATQSDSAVAWSWPGSSLEGSPASLWNNVSIISAGIPDGAYDGENVAELTSSWMSSFGAEIYQNLTVTPNTKCVISFEAEVEATPTVGVLFLGLGGSEVSLDIGTSGWTQYRYTVTPTDSTGLFFNWNDIYPPANSQTLYLDDVSVTPAPEPITMLTDAFMLLPLGASAVRQLRKKLQAA
jgi:hypothetical protein